MSPYPAPGRFGRKWRKFRRDPVRFFADARNPLLQRSGLWALVAGQIVGDLPRALVVLAARLFGARQREIRIQPAAQLRLSGELWESTGNDPQFNLILPEQLRRGGWVRFHISSPSCEDFLEPVLYVDEGTGFSEQSAIRLPATDGDPVSRIVLLPPHIKGLRLDPMARPGHFRIGSVGVEFLTYWEVLRHSLGEEHGKLPAVLGRTRSGSRPAVSRNDGISRDEYARWISRYDSLSTADCRRMRHHVTTMKTRPLFSIVMPVFESHMPWLREAVESIQAQIYPDWELCVVDDASSSPSIVAYLDDLAAQDSRIRVFKREKNGGIVAASNDALAMTSGDWIVSVDHDDRLADHALYHLAVAIQNRPDAAIFYSDHDQLTPAGERANPYFKPDWNYELALGQNLANHMTAFRREDVLRVGGFRPAFEGSQDWDLLLRLIEEIPGEAVQHIPHVLYHWRSDGSSFSQSQAARAWNAGRRAVQAHLDRTGQDAVAMPGANGAGHLAVRWQLPENPPLVSIIIPTRDRVDLLRQCMDGLNRRTDYPNFEIILVDNGSEQTQTLDYYETLRNQGRARILKAPGEFNFSHLCNRGVEAAHGEIYALLNNDVNPINSDWLAEMVSHALRPGVGAVGAKLYYPDGSIQHGGIILGVGGIAGHAHAFLPRNADGYQGRARLTQRLSAVTAACLVGRKEVFTAVGGLDEVNLKVAFNDVDFCLRIGEAEYSVIWTPFAELYHHESASRGTDTSPEKAQRFRKEHEYMNERWCRRLSNDAAYNPNLDLTNCGRTFALDIRNGPSENGD